MVVAHGEALLTITHSPPCQLTVCFSPTLHSSKTALRQEPVCVLFMSDHIFLRDQFLDMELEKAQESHNLKFLHRPSLMNLFLKQK